MSSVTWNDSLKIGIPHIDLQHQQLINQMDKLAGVLDDKNKTKEAKQKEIKQVVKFLNGYVNIHFNYEEGCMNLYECPVACENKKSHERFLSNFEEVKRMLDAGDLGPILMEKLDRDLIQWFVNHIRQIDTQLQTAMERRGVKRK